ncbi:MAG: hypothetical protein ACSHXH_14120 [Marivita sp.]
MSPHSITEPASDRGGAERDEAFVLAQPVDDPEWRGKTSSMASA